MKQISMYLLLNSKWKKSTNKQCHKMCSHIKQVKRKKKRKEKTTKEKQWAKIARNQIKSVSKVNKKRMWNKLDGWS